MIATNHTAEQKLAKARVKLMTMPEWRYMAGVIMMGDAKVVDSDDTKCLTACTDGLNEMYNRGFVESLSQEQVMFLILHENFHKMFRHLHIWQHLFQQNAQAAAIACDAVINNQYLSGKAGIAFIEGVVDLPKYADPDKWNAKRIFDDLLKHSDQLAQMAAESASGEGTLDSHDYEAAQAMTKAEQEVLAKQVDAALRQASLAGSMAGGMPRGITEMLVPPLDWRSLLAEFVKQRCAGKDRTTWRRPHRTYIAHDLYLPDYYAETAGKILICGDTSGSIGNAQLSVFLGYMQQLVNEVEPSGVDIAWWGSDVVGVDRMDREQARHMAAAAKPVSGGGTEPQCIPAWLRKERAFDQYVCAVVLTDGEFYGDGVGDWQGLPVLWLVINDGNTSPIPVGTVVKVKELV